MRKRKKNELPPPNEKFRQHNFKGVRVQKRLARFTPENRMKIEVRCDLCDFWIQKRTAVYYQRLNGEHFKMHKICYESLTGEEYLKDNMLSLLYVFDKKDFVKRKGIIQEDVEAKRKKVKIVYKNK